MATYAAFKHVELYNVGNAKKRVLKPPGGGSSDLFGADNEPLTPRSMNKNRMQSNIFAVPEAQRAGNVFRQGIHRYYFLGGDTPRRAVQGQDSHNRLFGEVDRPYTPVKNHMKSNLPIGADKADGATKANGHSNGTKTNGHHSNGNGHAPTNGHSSNGSNGTANGHTNGTSSSAPSQNGSTHTSPKSSSSTSTMPRSPRFAQRNPVTGNGVEDYADKPRKPSSRRGCLESGNPVTGEGYKSGGAAEINTTVPSLNGSGNVINKNRIPPGGFSSGLW
ncbi:microtubule-associated protein Jupiter isoform X2 [Toxorhynchites rutilus septentrionalis]|uniref:microtubule-associated protein Jupiter isoform X2 n=1 Tax=Toxorhynchites rutilus septentrionalis TaxID=329112 RepID=UPI00247905B6|nr:microtubule-associated protein Jupiter isoform X2 [Toxorhynchites rutilus septentrionalis]